MLTKHLYLRDGVPREAELGADWRSLVASFEEDTLVAASIGQACFASCWRTQSSVVFVGETGEFPCHLFPGTCKFWKTR
jgi:hypothetical protein